MATCPNCSWVFTNYLNLRERCPKCGHRLRDRVEEEASAQKRDLGDDPVNAALIHQSYLTSHPVDTSPPASAPSFSGTADSGAGYDSGGASGGFDGGGGGGGGE